MSKSAEQYPTGRLRKGAEILANFGLLMVAVGLVCPIVSFSSPDWIVVFKWVYTVGAGLYTIARIAGSVGKEEPFRIRRLRRLEVWAGIAFCIGAFFWFYNTAADKISDSGLIPYLTFKLFQETIIFTLVGALIQIVASCMYAVALKKQKKEEKGE